MPAMAAGTCRRKQRNVAVATSGTEACRLQFLPGKRLCAGVDLDPWKIALGRESLYERAAAGTLLTDCFVVHDGTADELRDPRGDKEHFPVGAPALLG